MGELHRFRPIKEYRIQKFNQQKLEVFIFGGSDNSGFCLGACFMWIENKLTRPDKLEKPLDRGRWADMFAERDGDDGQEDVDYRIFSEGNRLSHFYYQRADKDPFNFHEIGQSLPSIRAVRSMVTSRGGWETGANDILQGLPKGHGVVIGFRFTRADGSRGLHSVAAYHSRGGTFYFFDPATGVYTFEPGRSLQFFFKWKSCYQHMGLSIGESGVHFVFSTYTRN